MANPVATPGQGIFNSGYSPRSVILEDASREVSTAVANEFVMGFPVALDGNATDQGKIKSVTDNAADRFLGVCASHVNVLRGKTSLGEFTANRIAVALQGIVTIRRTVLLDSTGTEVTISPFTSFSGTNGFPVATDIGLNVEAIEVTSEAALGSKSILKWGIGAGSSTGFTNVAMILDVRLSGTDGEEVDLWLPGGISAARATDL